VEAGSRPVAQLTLTGPGKQLYELMGLRGIAQAARHEVLMDLSRVEPDG
jgi:hypothetical protein